MSNLTGFAEVTFSSGASRCRARHFPGVGDAYRTAAGRPVIVMAHGLAGTVDSGLEPFAAGLSAAGFDVLAFDYRGFGASGGQPRQRVSVTGQVDDYRAALAAVATLPGADAGRRVLWGVSLSGGHVLAAAASVAGAGSLGGSSVRKGAVGEESVGAGGPVAAVVSLTPLVDGPAAGRHAMAYHSRAQMLRAASVGVRSRLAGLRGRPPVMIPVVGPPGTRAALTLDGSDQHYRSLAGPTWVNRIDADVVLEIGRYRPGRTAAMVRSPTLVQIADLDRSAPPQAAARAAFRARALVRHYPCDHWDVWPGRPWFEPVLAHQLAFLHRVFRAP